MRRLKNMAIRNLLCIVFLSILFFPVSIVSAQKKVVVVPLGEDSVNTGPVTRVLSIPAAAMNYTSTAPITVAGYGLQWRYTYSGGTNITIKAPDNYAGGDVKFHIFFETTTATDGIVSFFLRPTSFDPGGSLYDPGSVNGDGVSVSGKTGFGNVYQQTFVIPANRMAKSWWNTVIQRQGQAPGETYSDDVVVLGAAFEYQATK